MNQSIIHQIKNPFPFLQIENFYSENELKLIWQELDFLNYPNKLKNPENTGSAKDDENKILKNNNGLFLDDIYAERNISNILSVNSKIFLPEILEAFSELSFGYQNIKKTDNDKTLISYYENGGYYKPHEDNALYTAITWFFKEPKAFTGGDLYFTDYDVKINIKNNMTVIFPSFVIHAVDEIILNDNLNGYGRYSMSQFLYLLGTIVSDDK
jgi:Rps23 Pro-64 3,4-dihydroxylase Tpa1-like proline 4-hydroxylase